VEESLSAGYTKAVQAIDSGAAEQLLDRWVAASSS
jgi:anthranilate phosphoribosyltransferase